MTRPSAKEPRPPSVELQFDSGGGRRRHVVRVPRAARVPLVLAGLALLVGLIVAAAVGPRALAGLRVRREYATQLARRSQLGERLTVLVEGLSQVEAESVELEQRLRELQIVYGLRLPAGPAGERESEVTAGGGVTIFAAAIARGRRLIDEVDRRLGRIGRALDALSAWEAEHGAEVGNLPLGDPIAGTTSVETSRYGVRRSALGGDLEFHAGVDLAAEKGSPIRSPSEGLVLWAGEPPTRASPVWWRLGRTVVIRHGERFLTIYGHCGRIDVRRGQRVRRGTVIAEVGDSGWTATPQLHYEIRRIDHEGAWQPIDPALLRATDAGARADRVESASTAATAEPLPSSYRR
ncbi:MAG TPA: M23 family metallopeptidase [Thermoanaerobaculia bacterium]|nr:M23 family metallopeptidase [Thermoanaerobaculia bacterium]